MQAKTLERKKCQHKKTSSKKLDHVHNINFISI